MRFLRKRKRRRFDSFPYLSMKIATTTVNEFLLERLAVGESPHMETSVKDVEAFIYQRLTSKQFRKTKMDETCVKRTQQAIHTRVMAQQPLKVVFPQGGYKLWRFPSSPTADWAEFFNLTYLVEYLLPIAQSYKPGVQLVYYLHTLLMEVHDNLTTGEIQAYVDSFQRLINEVSQHLPSNFSISILRDADIYTRDEYFQKLEVGKQKAEGDYALLPLEKKQDLQRMASLNIKWEGRENWQALTEAEKAEKIELAALYEMAASSNLEKVFEQVKSPENVLLFTKATKDFIGVGSTKNSVAKHWVGFGVLEQNNKGELVPRVLTPSQYQQALKQPYQKFEVSLLPDRNFQEILVFEQSFDFKKP